MAEKTTVSKNKTASVGKYSYKYTDLAQIHEEMERQGLRYFQHIETENGVDYMVTTLTNVEGEALRTCRGCRVVDANGQNPTRDADGYVIRDGFLETIISMRERR